MPGSMSDGPNAFVGPVTGSSDRQVNGSTLINKIVRISLISPNMIHRKLLLALNTVKTVCCFSTKRNCRSRIAARLHTARFSLTNKFYCKIYFLEFFELF